MIGFPLSDGGLIKPRPAAEVMRPTRRLYPRSTRRAYRPPGAEEMALSNGLVRDEDWTELALQCKIAP